MLYWLGKFKLHRKSHKIIRWLIAFHNMNRDDLRNFLIINPIPDKRIYVELVSHNPRMNKTHEYNQRYQA